MVTGAVSRQAGTERQRRTGPEPTYPLGPLLTRTGLAPDEFADRVGVSRATLYRRARNGVTWTEADEWSVAFGYLPYEVWPQWALADPTDWWDIPADPDGEPPAASTHRAA